jgi:hypothetical protein
VVFFEVFDEDDLKPVFAQGLIDIVVVIVAVEIAPIVEGSFPVMG